MQTKIINKKIKGDNRHWKNFLDKNYLGSHNLEEGEEMLLTISKFEGEEKVKTADGDKVKFVLYFKEPVPKMIMNVTNGNILSSLYGSHPNNWIGKKIQVYAASIRAFGKDQDALRIRDFKPKDANANVTEHKAKLDVATTLEELGTIWKKLPRSVQSVKEIEDYKNTLKIKLTPNENN
jgi:hypothetical protein